MSYTNLIKETLDIPDLNITFNEHCLKKEQINERICQVFYGTLDYTAHVCPHCEGEEKEAGDYPFGFYNMSDFTE